MQNAKKAPVPHKCQGTGGTKGLERGNN